MSRRGAAVRDHGALDSSAFFSYLHSCDELASEVFDGASASGSNAGDVVGGTSCGRPGAAAELGAISRASSRLLGRLASRRSPRAEALSPEKAKPQPLVTRSLQNQVDDDCTMVTISNPSSSSRVVPKSAACDASAPLRCAFGRHVAHEFELPLVLSTELLPTKGRHKGAGRRAPGRARFHLEAQENRATKLKDVVRAVVESHNEPSMARTPSHAPMISGMPMGWKRASLADVLYAMVENGHLNIHFPVDAQSSPWYFKNTVANCGPTAIDSLRRALQDVGLDAIMSYLMLRTRPQSSLSTWYIFGNIVKEKSERCEDKKADSGPVCSLQFRVIPPSLESPEALHMQFIIHTDKVCQRLYPYGIARRGGRIAECRFDWRVGPASTTRSRKRVKTDEETFRLLDTRNDPAAAQPLGFQRWPLREEQLRTLHWMQLRESQQRAFEFTGASFRVTPEGEPHFAELPAPPVMPESMPWSWTYDIRSREFYHIRGGILGDAIGYGKTATTIGLIDSRRAGLDVVDPAVPESDAPSFFESQATLILAPSNLVDQWVGEFDKFLGGDTMPPLRPPLRVLVVRTVANLKVATVRQIVEEVDVVLCSYRLFYSPIYRSRLVDLAGLDASLCPDSDIEALRAKMLSFRRDPCTVRWKNYSRLCEDSFAATAMELRFPVLEQFWWRRIVFDEFHELEARSMDTQFSFLKNLCSHYRWGLTGTPPTKSVKQIETLASLFQIGNFPCERTCTGYIPAAELAREAAQHFLDSFARQNSSEEALSCELVEHIVDVNQDPLERAIYMQALHDADATAWNDDGTAHCIGHNRMERLVRLCSHFASGCGAPCEVGDAQLECQRILETKRRLETRARSSLHAAAAFAEWSWRLAPVPSKAIAMGPSSGETTPMVRELCVAISDEEMPGLKLDDTNASEQSPTAHFRAVTIQRLRERYAALSVAAPAGVVDGPDLQPSAMVEEAYSTAVAALAAAARLPTNALRQCSRVGRRASAAGVPDQAADPNVPVAMDEFLKAVSAYDITARSLRFFSRTLEATRGETSAEHRACSICLDEDIPCSELSITSCAHVFHKACIHAVLRQYATCPVCRQQLNGAKDVMPLEAELAGSDCAIVADAKRRRECKDESASVVDQPGDADLARKFGSKLVALAKRLRLIQGKGEKAIVFCQWEDLKKKIADALCAFGISGVLQLAGGVSERGRTIRRFQNEAANGASVLLLSLEHAASGTNLTAANHVVFIHPMIAASAEKAVAYEAQAIGRCQRRGQTRQQVHIWRFVTRGTVEESISAEHRRDFWEAHLSNRVVAQPTAQ